MDISEKAWKKFASRLSNINKTATSKVEEFINKYPGFSFEDPESMSALVDYAYGISTKYGEAAAEMACQMYDEVAKASKVAVPPAVPANTPVFKEVNGTITESAKFSQNIEYVAGQVGKLVKRTGCDTTLQNAERDHAQFAWIPNGEETCAFCLALASKGWQYVSAQNYRHGHAEHIHGNCDCTYAVRFSKNNSVKGYNPEKYQDIYYGAELKEGQKENAKNRLNAVRRFLNGKND